MASELMLINPSKRKRARRKPAPRRKSPRRRRNPIAVNPRRRKYRRRRNPRARAKGIGKIFQASLMPAAVAACGAIGLDVAMGFLPLPAQMKTGPMRHLVKGAGAIAMGMVAGMVVKPDTAQRFTTGALTVTMYDAGKEMLQRFAPNLQLGYYEDNDLYGLGYYGAGYNPSDDMSAIGFYPNDMSGMGTLTIEDELNL